jgi:hypothetical protein
MTATSTFAALAAIGTGEQKRRVPTAGERNTGFPCGEADVALFNWLHWYSTGQLMTAIEAAGLTPDDATLAQLAQALSRSTDIPVLGWQATPPVSPSVGHRYIVAVDGTGAWEDHNHEIAIYIGGAWVFVEPSIGQQANYMRDDFYRIIYFTGSVWADYGRKTLTEDLTIYVATDGDDDDDGLTVGTPFLTLQRAVQLARSIDTAGYSITVDAADGTYSGAGAILDAPLIGGGSLYFEGNPASPGSATISNTGSSGNTSAVLATGGGQVIVNGFTLSSTNSHCLSAQGAGSVISYYNVIFANATNGNHVNSFGGGQCIAQSGTYSITGNARQHYSTSQGGSFFNNGGSRTVNVIGTLTFSGAFASASLSSSIDAQSMTFSVTGTVTGTRYSAGSTSTIFTGGGGANYFPGSVAGAEGGNGYYG